MTFKNWLLTFLSEKGIDLETTITAEGPSGFNYIPLECLVAMMCNAPKREQDGIKAMMVRLDFRNAPIIPYLNHLALAVAR